MSAVLCAVGPYYSLDGYLQFACPAHTIVFWFYAADFNATVEGTHKIFLVLVWCAQKGKGAPKLASESVFGFVKFAVILIAKPPGTAYTAVDESELKITKGFINYVFSQLPSLSPSSESLSSIIAIKYTVLNLDTRLMMVTMMSTFIYEGFCNSCVTLVLHLRIISK